MDIKILVTVFVTVFIAELGDKTQLATLLFASKAPGNLIAVFVGASAALIVASAVGVLAGGLISQYVSPCKPKTAIVCGRCRLYHYWRLDDMARR
jgi:putative Ca2+/H+ antiporter (TMEM165/GDT1 family)